MKIYFAGSIRGGRDDVHIYEQIIIMLKKHGEVLTEHIGDKTLSVLGIEDGPNDEYIYTRDVEWLRSSDILIAEVTTHSIGVGYEIGYAEALGKRIICLYREGASKKISAMIAGNKNIMVINYQEVSELITVFDDIFK